MDASGYTFCCQALCPNWYIQKNSIGIKLIITIIFWEYMLFFIEHCNYHRKYMLFFIEHYNYHRLWRVQFGLNIYEKLKTGKMVKTFTKTVFFSKVIIMHSIILNFLQNESESGSGAIYAWSLFLFDFCMVMF